MELTTTAAPNPTLADALEFSPEDLAANQAGHLSEMQRYRLRVRRIRSIGIGLTILLSAVFAASLFFYLGTREGGSAILGLVGIGVTIISAVVSGIFARYWMRLNADIRGDEVQVLQGRVERVLKPINRRNITYLLRLGDAEMLVTKQAFTAFEHETEYILYRLPHTGALLTAERVSES